MKTTKVISWRSLTHLCVSRLSHNSTDTAFPLEAADYFSHMYQRRQTVAGKKVCGNQVSNRQPPGDESDMQPTVLPGRAWHHPRNCMYLTLSLPNE